MGPSLSIMRSGCVINMTSRGFQDCAFVNGNPSTIAVNESIVISVNSRGFYLVPFESVLCTVGNLRRFYTSAYSGNSQNETDYLVEYVDGLSNGTLVLSIMWDDVTSQPMTSAYPFILSRLGVDLNPLQFRGKFAFITQIGNSERAIVDLLAPGGPPADLTVYV